MPEGFQVTLFAAEPDVNQPIAMTTDDRGRLWVIENYTYAERDVNFETEKLRDRILIFEDTSDESYQRRSLLTPEYLSAADRSAGRALFKQNWMSPRQVPLP